MNNADEIKTLFSTFAVYLPRVIICLVACIVIAAKWREAGGGALWALLGFGLALILCFVMPIGQTMIQHWVMEDGDRLSRMWAFSAFAMLGSVLQVVVYLFLLIAIFAGRSKTDPRDTALHGLAQRQNLRLAQPGAQENREPDRAPILRLGRPHRSR